MADYFFEKGEFCGICKKSASDLASDQGMKRCTGCKVARYCSKECQKEDLKSHKPDCKKVKHFLDMFPGIEEKFSNWKWSEHRNFVEMDENLPPKIRARVEKPPKREKPEDLFQTILGQFCSFSKRNHWEFVEIGATNLNARYDNPGCGVFKRGIQN